MLRTWEEKYAVLLDLEVAHLCLEGALLGFKEASLHRLLSNWGAMASAVPWLLRPYWQITYDES